MHTPTRHMWRASAWLVLAIVWAGAAHANKIKADEPKRSSRTGGSVKIVPSGSEENTAARDKRLKRECRGRPNAGACLGHAS